MLLPHSELAYEYVPTDNQVILEIDAMLQNMGS